jgi:predicted ATP-dependent endonuclease of OLD family
MLYKQFRIKNFKGISQVIIDLTKNNRVITLVGLNESGKTTVMQAIELFYRSVKDEEPSKDELNRFRPKGISFTGLVEIEGILEFEEGDVVALQKYWKDDMNKRKKLIIGKDFSYSFKFKYEVHEYKTTNRVCNFSVKSDGASRDLHSTDKEAWLKLIKYVKEQLMPEILYYEDFIFEIPEKIEFPLHKFSKQQDGTMALTSTAKEIQNDEKNSTWQLVLNDVLKTVDPKLTSFQKHIADIWESDPDTAKNRVSQMERMLNEKITTAWRQLFGGTSKKLNFKEISLSPEPKEDRLNVSFGVKTDAGDIFSINERSKGCKWFFSFLFFTEFRKMRTRNILFLLDEPASNLHSFAQKKILEAINSLSRQSMVIYSTHSHHLIEVKWLSGAYVIVNEVITDDILTGNVVALDQKAKISAEKYYDYVGQGRGSDKVSYFQPILDALDYQPSYLEPAPNLILLEGKNDWYMLKYFQEIILKNKAEFRFYPGGGAGKQNQIIQLYLSWGQHFLVLLDGDKEGEKAKKVYFDEFPNVLENKIFTLHDAVALQKKAEDLISDEDKKKIFETVYGVNSYKPKANNKKALNRAIMELLKEGKPVALSKETKDNFRKLLKFITDKLSTYRKE